MINFGVLVVNIKEKWCNSVIVNISKRLLKKYEWKTMVNVLIGIIFLQIYKMKTCYWKSVKKSKKRLKKYERKSMVDVLIGIIFSQTCKMNICW